MAPKFSDAPEPIRIEGLDELMGLLHKPEWFWRPAGRFLDRWRFDVEGGAKRNITRGPGGWADTGDTRRSLTSERDKGREPVWAAAGSNKPAARWGDYGTGLLSEDPESKHQRHWPPAKALEPWAKKHKIPDRNNPDRFLTGADIARIIGMRGGLAPRRFLRDAAAATEKRVPEFMQLMAKDVEQEAGKHGRK